MAVPDVPLTTEDATELVDDWLVSLRGAGKAPATLVGYERGARQYLAFCISNELAPIRRRSLSGWMAALSEQGMQPYTARSRLTAVRQFTKWLLAEGEIEFNPFTDFEQPALEEKRIEPLTSDQIRAMIAACTPPKGATAEREFVDVRDAAIIQLMVETGLRAGEVIGLAIDDVRWKDTPPAIVVQRSKTRRGRSVPISPQAAERIGRYVRQRRKRRHEQRDEFWLAARGGPLQYAGLYDALAKRASDAGVDDFHPHRMRHTAAHRWLAAGGSESGLMSVAGWRSPQMLHRYTRAQAEARAAEEAKRLNLGEL